MAKFTRPFTFALAGGGALVFYLLGLPLPFLLGPMFACLLAALGGMKLQGAGQFGIFMRTFLGVAVGASITPELIGNLPAIAGSLAFVPLFIAANALVGYPLLRFAFKYDRATSWYSAMPGGLQDMLVFGEESGGNPRVLSIIHATRILVLVSCAPFIIQYFWNLDLSQAPGAPIASMDPVQIALMVCLGLAGWKLFERIGLFGASILGPMILTTICSLLGLIEARPPAEIIQAAQFFIGIAVGIKYVGITMQEIRTNVVAGLLYAILMGVIAALFFQVVVALGLASSLEALLAFLPGGQAEMVVITIIAGADLAYVISHHILRIVIVVILAPLIEKYLP